MKKLFLGLALTLFALSGVYSAVGQASGAVIVFLARLMPNEYLVISARKDPEFNNSAIANGLENSHNSVYVMRLYPSVYNDISYYARQGYDVKLTFEDSSKIMFRYFPSLNAVLGQVDGSDDVYILQWLNTHPD